MKVIEIVDRGFVWHVPLKFVAENRADHYADDPDSTRDEEISFVMEDNYEGLDWFLNNMNFSDVRHVSKLVETPTTPDEPQMDECECHIITAESPND